ncbi:MAG TPA: hypothetical protein VMM59_08110 [Thermohalobaculum sp.]|nr:hypothetical protein [Thermohalobaculum sp.]
MPARNLVVRSIETPDGLRCVDIIRHPDGAFGFAEFRRDPEDPSGWHPTGLASPEPLASAEAALAAARRQVAWLAEVLGR